MAGIFKIFLALALVLTSGLAEELEIDWSLNELDQDDPKLIQIIKEKYLIPPSDKPYNFSQTPDNKLDLSGQHDQPISVSNILDKKRNGFFVEAGAYDGKYDFTSFYPRANSSLGSKYYFVVVVVLVAVVLLRKLPPGCQ